MGLFIFVQITKLMKIIHIFILIDSQLHRAFQKVIWRGCVMIQQIELIGQHI